MPQLKCDTCPRAARAREKESVERREVLLVGAAGGLSLLAPACSSAPESAGPGSEPDASEGGNDSGANDAAAGDGDGAACAPSCATGPAVVTATFAKYPALKQVGGSALITASNYADPSCQMDSIIVAQPTAGHYVALSASCTHACCTVFFTGTAFSCPCHHSSYDLNGQVTGGPAPAPLQKLTVCADDCGVHITLL
jgi:thiosulfate dehydrogenase [quinone] large subunit